MSKNLSRRQMLGMMGSASAAAAMGAFPNMVHGAQSLGPKPNLVFILGDNHRYDALRCMGHPFIETPGIDRLASEGVVFENSFNTTSLCSPSRASILTGVHASTHLVRNNHTPWTGRMPTFIEHLSGSGYETAFIGKWHMPGKGLPDLSFLDLFVSYTYREGQGTYFNCPLVVNGHMEPSRSEYITTEMTDRAIEFIGKRRQAPDGSQKPFCVYLSHRSAHPPFRAPRGVAGMYDDVEVKMPRQTNPLWFGKTGGNVFQGVMMGSYDQQYRRYCETITAMDRDIARLLNWIEQRGLAENTVVIYMGDNGMQWGEHGCHGIREPYEESIRLPFVVRGPRLIPDAGSRRKQMALNIDIAPTMLDLAGVSIPKEMEGESLLPYLKDGNTMGRENFLLEFWRYYPENTPSYFGVRTRRHKYIEFERGRSPWLFDLAADPNESANLFGTPAGDEVLPELKAALQRQKALRISS